MPHYTASGLKFRKLFKPPVIKCKKCNSWFRNKAGYTNHNNRFHATPTVGQNEPGDDLDPPPIADQNALDETGDEAGSEPDYDADQANMELHEINSQQSVPNGNDLMDTVKDEQLEAYFGSPHNSERPHAISLDETHQRISLRLDHELENEGVTEKGPDEEQIHSRKEREYHPVLTGLRCDRNGEFVPSDAPPPPPTPQHDWTPYRDQVEFEIADLIFRRSQMPQSQIDQLMHFWAARSRLTDPDAQPPFANHQDLFNIIDSTPNNVPWDSFTVGYSGPLPEDPPSWMYQEHEVWFRDPRAIIQNMLRNREYEGEFDYIPYKDYDEKGRRKYKDLLSGDWAWLHADLIAADVRIQSKGCMLLPIILGSDKTTVSVATGQNDFYPLYISLGSVHNNVRRAHRGAVAVLAFLANVKTDRQHSDDFKFKAFRRQLFHSSLSKILSSLKEGMTKYQIMLCPDGYFRRVIFEIGPYIADYPEQVLLACILQGWCARCLSIPKDLDAISGDRNREHSDLATELFSKTKLAKTYGIIKELVPFTNDFPRADIHELMAPDLLHQIIKGVFKDYLVKWVELILIAMYGEKVAGEIMDDIDNRIALVPPFAGLRRFPQGRGFKQWTGDDSKALMKVYLPALVGHLPDEVVLAMRAFLDFCYLVRRSVLTEGTLDEIDDALSLFLRSRVIFQEMGVRGSFSVPRLHSIVHYKKLIRYFGAPNGLCSSITESKHIDAVKRPWRRSNKFNALGQMLKTNSRLDCLRSSRTLFKARGMLRNLFSDEEIHDVDDDIFDDNVLQDQDEGEAPDGQEVLSSVKLASTPRRDYPRDLQGLSEHTGFPTLSFLTRKFYFRQTHPEERGEIPPDFLIDFNPHVDVFHAAAATFYAPSDPSGTGGMRREQIRATPSWRKKTPRYDTVFVETDSEKPGMLGMHIARVFLFFSFVVNSVEYQCALVNWFSPVDEKPDELTGMWIVSPEYTDDDELYFTVIHVETILRAAHLIPCYGEGYVADYQDIDSSQTLDVFNSFYVNKYIDHHANEIAF